MFLGYNWPSIKGVSNNSGSNHPARFGRKSGIAQVLPKQGGTHKPLEGSRPFFSWTNEGFLQIPLGKLGKFRQIPLLCLPSGSLGGLLKEWDQGKKGSEASLKAPVLAPRLYRNRLPGGLICWVPKDSAFLKWGFVGGVGSLGLALGGLRPLNT